MRNHYFFKIILLLIVSIEMNAQQFTVTEMATMPKSITNNAVTNATVAGSPYVYSFGGLDSTKLFSGITLNSFRYNVLTDTWSAIANLPDTLGKIASAASVVKNKIYIMGGYHVLSSGAEISSNKVHVYDPENNVYEADAASIPIAIDDQVQAVWRDSLIYVITGWSNVTNVPNVQVFNPTSNTWLVGASVPNTTIYKAFGASGVIVGDTIFYYGGASTAVNFPAQSKLRMGIIDPINPTIITWSNPSNFENTYRCAATSDSLGNVYFLGGSSVSYNYNGIAYNGSGGVNPNVNYDYFNVTNPTAWDSLLAPLPMDLRGIANTSADIKYIAGGMETGQVVSHKTLKLQLAHTIGIQESSLAENELIIFNNRNNNYILFQLKNKNDKINRIDVLNLQGEKLLTVSNEMNEWKVITTTFKRGYYLFLITTTKGVIKKKIVVD
jgi:Kelch motif